MNAGFFSFDHVHLLGESAIYAQAERPSGTRPLAFMPFRVRLLVRLPLHPQVPKGHKGQAGFVKPLKRQRLRSRASLRGPARSVVASRQTPDQTHHRTRPTAVSRLKYKIGRITRLLAVTDEE